MAGSDLVLVHFFHGELPEQTGLGERLENEVHVVRDHHPVLILHQGFDDRRLLRGRDQVVQHGWMALFCALKLSICTSAGSHLFGGTEVTNGFPIAVLAARRVPQLCLVGHRDLLAELLVLLRAGGNVGQPGDAGGVGQGALEKRRHVHLSDHRRPTVAGESHYAGFMSSWTDTQSMNM